MFYLAKNNRLLFRSERYEKILECLTRIKQITQMDYNTFLKFEGELTKGEIKALIKEYEGKKRIEVINPLSESDYSRVIDENTVVYD